MAPSILLAISIGQLPTEPCAHAFSPQEADRIVTFWNQEGRLKSEDLHPTEPFQPVYAPAASVWLHEMYKKRDPGRPLIPTKIPAPRTERDRQWDLAIDRQMAQDFAWATSAAAWMNRGLAESATIGSPTSRTLAALPADLLAVAGEPPPFYEVNRPQRATVVFDGFYGVYSEAVDVPNKYLFYRSACGTATTANPPSESDLRTLVHLAGISTKLVKPILAVAQLEGGFDTVNTYDSGGISLGIIQFASLPSGRGSLVALLQSYRQKNPAEYAANFRKYGVDVAPDGRLTVVDPRTGFELSGSDAVQAVVEDKRLTAVFQRAATLSQNFKSAQLRLFAQAFNPAGISIPVTLGGQSISVPVTKFITSESGMATLMDRLVNRGNLDGLPEIVGRIARDAGVTTVSGLAGLERPIVEAMTYRNNFLAVSALTQPPAYSGPAGDARIAEISGTPVGPANGVASAKGGIGKSGGLGASEPLSVAPFDPTRAGRVAPPAGAAPQASKPADPSPAKAPTPTTPAGPITVAGG
ncbi:MAG: hypothetical protein JNM28_01755 [Armatimonadetes bacterium]|nr:hypothetical protein [Armatimonadota bacterium]MBS1710968.1 hypothetical protein [Armatimonadota bacterium]MBX3108640.1 hypothetical protein [Fimbriimonadaceae bacterium]